ncbi:MAG TPA: GNAT family N-acetyltransferase [Pseudonocardiaceae bacterium]|nr:GNAT family N-acetyltransferase [Pseudonocardiaceae bacterium]
MTSPDVLADAMACATSAAAAANVDIREVARLPEFAGIADLYDEIWRPSTSPPVNTELLRALNKAGNYVAAAFDGGKLVGACVGFFTAPVHSALHSHIAGVSATVLGRHVGYALKLHQRAWALRHDVRLIEWTFDPLVARNAYFNIVKLAGRPTEYLPNFYGGMADGINGDDDTDRLLLRWELAAPRVTSACAGRREAVDAAALRARGAATALRRGDRGEPVAGPSDADTVLVAVPRDVEALRVDDQGLAKEWRAAVREVLGGLLAGGARVTGFDRGGWYVVQR